MKTILCAAIIGLTILSIWYTLYISVYSSPVKRISHWKAHITLKRNSHHQAIKLPFQPTEQFGTRSLDNHQRCYLNTLYPKSGGPVQWSLEHPSIQELKKRFSNLLQPDGHGRPNHCVADHRVAIIVPYRNRELNLRTFLNHMHPFLLRQPIDYRIFVIEQNGTLSFNRGMLMNIGFTEARRMYNFTCFIFHDVDLLPLDDRNLYTCSDNPRHLSVAIDIFNFKLPYSDIFGGVCAIKPQQFTQMNGFPNAYWGWGGEDDDLALRSKSAGLTITRYPLYIARYTMLSHHKNAQKNPERPLYKDIFGGVCAIKPEQFIRMNGYSNVYWNWGAEDDDMALR
ncbi:beta-1,4-N-acetylgalactosaminyltransferase bre-4-like [Tubulanus polymorphus]|uniref:beta-1,4-N-acetylgalactosaminyltransferase bre-4-like n=1 Tax=Tubulanus polymorphus TaxID=672921 RepID=UPI003DA5F4EE